jgi:plastocyanin
VARIWLTPSPSKFTGIGPVAQSSALVNSEGWVMHMVGTVLVGMSCLGGLAVGPAAAQDVHQIKLEADAGKEDYRFSPASVTARPGDVLVFKVVSGAPHSIVFEGAGLSENARASLNAALGRRAGDLTGPLLTENGSEYRITVPVLPAGTYRFFCLPHRAYDERGELRIK